MTMNHFPEKFNRRSGAASLCATILLLGVVMPQPSQAAAKKRTSSVAGPFSLVFTSDDGSLPPSFRRDLNLTVTGSTMRVTATSYGTVVADITKQIPTGVLLNVQKLALALKKTNKEVKSCPGGKANSLTYSVGKVTVKRTVAICGSTNATEFEQNWAVVEPLLGLLGDRDKSFHVGEDPSQVVPTTSKS